MVFSHLTLDCILNFLSCDGSKGLGVRIDFKIIASVLEEISVCVEY